MLTHIYIGTRANVYLGPSATNMNLQFLEVSTNITENTNVFKHFTTYTYILSDVD